MTRSLRLAIPITLALWATSAHAGLDVPPAPPVDPTAQINAAIAAAPFVKTVQSIGPDGTGNVAGIATASALSNIIIAGDVIQVSNPATGATVTPPAGVTVELVNNTALLLALTVAMPSSPADGQRFTVACASGITALTLTGGTLKGGIATLSVSGYARFIYSANAGYWFRIG